MLIKQIFSNGEIIDEFKEDATRMRHMLESQPGRILNLPQTDYNLEKFQDISNDIFNVSNKDLLFVVQELF